jgi:hypothetical protein
MSSPLAIGAVSAVLRDLLDNGMIQAGSGPVKVSAVAPDIINLEEAGFSPRLNLFLYQVTPNSGWRNSGLPSRSAANGERLTNAPLALDLHYLLTAYAHADFEAEILLGYAMHLLHERPVLDRAAIRRALSPSPLNDSLMPPAFRALVASDLADQVEQIKITPSAQSSDEMSKLWSAIQSKYRPSAAYQVSVVLIEGKRPAVSPLPVLTRGKPIPGTQRDEGVAVNPDVLPPLPALFEARPKDNQPAARLGEPVTIEGMRLAGAGHEVRLVHRLFPSFVAVSPVTVSADGKEVTFTLPNDPAALAAGQLSATIHFIPAGETVARETNAIPLVIAPDPKLGTATTARGAAVVVTLAPSPHVRPAQQAILMLDGAEAVAELRTGPADPVIFKFPLSLPANTDYRARLRVDGSDSILIIRKDPVPIFDDTQKIHLP